MLPAATTAERHASTAHTCCILWARGSRCRRVRLTPVHPVSTHPWLLPRTAHTYATRPPGVARHRCHHDHRRHTAALLLLLHRKLQLQHPRRQAARSPAPAPAAAQQAAACKAPRPLATAAGRRQQHTDRPSRCTPDEDHRRLNQLTATGCNLKREGACCSLTDTAPLPLLHCTAAAPLGPLHSSCRAVRCGKTPRW